MQGTLLFYVFLWQAAAQGSPYSFLFMMVGMLLIFYFFLIRPQNKRAKDQQDFIANLKAGDKVVTAGGIHGQIVAINDDNTFTIKVDLSTKLKIERSMISLEGSRNLQQQSQATLPSGGTENAK